MNLKITKEITLTETEIKDIIVRYLHDHHGLSGIFDVDFILEKKPYPQDCILVNHYITEFSGAKVRISENE